MKYLRFLSRLILGATFLFSGFVKAVDPLGSAYKFGDYFTAFGLGFLDFAALPLGVILSAFELILGITLVMGYLRKPVAVVTFWFMSFFTLLTLVLAIFNPVHDCGCFGDAIILSNWQTFFKNLILMIFVLILFYGRTAEERPRTWFPQLALVSLFSLMAILFSSWNLKHLPLIDFRPYSIGTTIADEMKIPEDAPADVYETTLIYLNKQSGEQEEFSLENYPKDTAQWVFVDSESLLVKKGFEPDISDFAIMDDEGYDIVNEILDFEGYTLLMVSHDLENAEPEALKRAWSWSKVGFFAEDYQFFAVTSTAESIVNGINQELGLGYGFHYADEIMLKTIVRSNPGFMLIRKGIIAGKWSYRDMKPVSELAPDWMELIGNAAVPFDEDLNGESFELDLDLLDFDKLAPELIYKTYSQEKDRRVVLIFLLGLVIIILLSSRMEAFRV